MWLTRRSFLLAAAAVPVASFAASRALAGVAPVYSEAGVAIDGTDPVSYFTEGAPIAGSPEIALKWMGAMWRFSSEANRAAFEAKPKAYAPRYGGYCAYAVSEGYTASTIPQAWKIVDGKLYLNHSRRIQRTWERDIPRRIAAANRNWPGLIS